MALDPGTRLGPYDVLEPIGAGGMGEVYRARDTRLDRDVAIKVLPEDYLENAQAMSRFEREAKAVAALSHPNILSIHDFGEHEGTAYTVTEFLEGQTLFEQLENGPIPVRQALDFAAQMAEGLASAHEKGIVHRDIKPGNLFVTTDGRLKILDFGLAKTGLAPPRGDGETRTIRVDAEDGTSPGAVLGTTRYMSPEQVRGEEVDHRSDIFSFGTVLLEMLTGERAFVGDSAVEVMNAILREDPKSSASAVATVPASVDRIIHRCLEKEPARRFQSARDLAFALRNTTETSSQSQVGIEALPAAPRRAGRIATIALATLVVGAVAGFFLGRGTSTPELVAPVKVKPLTHSGRDWSPSVSPDQSMVAFVSNRDGRDRIWLRQMKGGVERPLTEGTGFSPKFSPDGSSILFLRAAGSNLSAYRVPVLGGAPRRVIDNLVEACWSPDGQKLAYTSWVGLIAEGKQSVSILDIATGENREVGRFDNRSLFGLDWSPDGRWIACAATGAIQNTTNNTIVLFDVATGESIVTTSKPFRMSAPTWTDDSKSLVYAESTSLLGDISGALGRVLLFDPFSGDERLLFWVQSVWGGAHQYVQFDRIGDDGLVFDEILWRGNLAEVRLDEANPMAAARRLTQGNSRDRQPAYSPDGEWVTFSSNRSGNLDVWTLRLETGELRQVTDDEANDWDPAFSHDGKSILWSSNRGGHLEIWMADADGGRARQVSQDGEDAENPTQTPDGQWVVYASANPGRTGIWKVRTDGSEEIQIAAGSFILPEVSPDGRHVIYKTTDVERLRDVIRVSDLESREVVFTTETPFQGFQRQIETGRARWLPDGSAFVFVDVNESRRSLLTTQEFRPDEDTTSTRRVLMESPADEDIESFGISPDGARITVSSFANFRTLKLATGVPGLQ